VLNDYRFVSIEIPEDIWVYNGSSQNINPDGSWVSLTAGDGTFKYVRDNDKSHFPEIKLQIKRNDEWQDYATADWHLGSLRVTLQNGIVQMNGVIDVPSDTQTFRTIVTSSNAAIDCDVRPVVELLQSTPVTSFAEAAFQRSNSPSVAVWNSCNMTVVSERDDSEIASITDMGYDSLRGYTTDISGHPKKTGTQM